MMKISSKLQDFRFSDKRNSDKEIAPAHMEKGKDQKGCFTTINRGVKIRGWCFTGGELAVYFVLEIRCTSFEYNSRTFK